MGEKKKRLCLFAGFDKRGEIAEYVVYYIKALSKIADVYYWGDFETSEQEKNKLKPYCKEIFCAPHAKYDFGSWQELVEQIGREKIESYDELILANDSCYGPLFDLSELFSEMEQRNCDFWGLSMAHLQHIHLQSYFMVLKHNILQSDVFYDFMKSVKPEKNHRMICARYEQRFTYVLNKAGFKFDSLIPYADLARHPYYDIETAIRTYHFPLLKVKFFYGEIRDQVPVNDWQSMISEYSKYPVGMIETDLRRRGLNLEEVKQILRENHNPLLNQDQNAPRTSKARQIIKKCVYHFAHIFDGYFDKKLNSYSLRDDDLARNYRNLKHELDLLKMETKDSSIRSYILKSTKKQETKIKYALHDYIKTHPSPLPLPLTDESDILLLGNIIERNLSIIGFDNYYPVYLNNLWIEDDNPNWFETKDFENFSFEYQNNQKVWFDLILSQPFANDVSNEEISSFIKNIKRQMVYEGALIMLVANDQVNRYQKLLEKEGLVSALDVRGLVVGNDPFVVYYDKIKSVKGYKALIYKIK